ncbi:MAG: cytochrome c biogenesis protein CcsA [Pirellulales bacterium]
MSAGANPFADVKPELLAPHTRHQAKEVNPVWAMLQALGSLKITVTAFFLAILLVLFGTLAQDEQNLGEVKRLYFNCWISLVPLDVFFPRTIFPEGPYPWAISFPFPGGATLGTVLLFNLIAAKLTRFHVSAKGGRLAIGGVISALGAALVALVIFSGQSAEGLQGAPPVSFDTLWILLLVGMSVVALAAVVTGITRHDYPTLARIAIWTSACILTLLCTVLWTCQVLGIAVRLDNSGMRIVWQLLQAGIASAVVLAGLILIFGRSGGNVLIHVGIALLMLGQFIFGDRQIEQHMSLIEGESSNLVFRMDEVELAVIDTSDPKVDHVKAIPQSWLERYNASEQPIDAEPLPFRIRIAKWMPNSLIRPLQGTAASIATAGIGTTMTAELRKPNGGVNSETNVASVYVELLDKQSNKSLGTYLLTQYLNDQKQLFKDAPTDQNESVTVDGKTYALGLRFRREYKPYQVFLEDVERKNYEVSDRPRDYSSHVVIRDGNGGSDFRGHIWMNNPVRYRNETFYQSKYDQVQRPDGSQVEMTGLQVVENSGWVIPYVSCMLVLLGMISHFSGTFLRFASRLDRGAIPTAGSVANPNAKTSFIEAAGVACVAAVLQLVFVGYMAVEKKAEKEGYDWTAAGKLPAMHEGRIKPLDAVARNVLQTLSEPLFGMTPTVKDDTGASRNGTAWLLALLTDKPWAADAKVFRLYSQEARDFFDLKPVSGFRYSYNELRAKSDDLRTHLREASRKTEKLSKEDERLAAVMRKIQLYDSLHFSYMPPPIPDEKDFGSSEAGKREFVSRLMSVLEYEQQIEASNPPALIPPPAMSAEELAKNAEQAGPAPKWQAFSPAVFSTFIAQKLGMRAEANPAILKYSEMADAFRENNPKKFNQSVAEYRTYVSELDGRASEVRKAAAESWLIKFNPTMIGVTFYLLAMILAFAGITSGSNTVQRTTWVVLLVTLLVHTIAIGARIYISGRPPVVNLYSSAVFIGWACVAFSLILELIFPMGVCNLSAAIIGVSTLSIARALDNSDTLHVLDAVLDTQFWLSTHVVTVALGYGATFMAGILGIVSLGVRFIRDNKLLGTQPRDNSLEVVEAIVARIIYGILCFAILFSFIGTVLGGLWADDSWGRFWGWDPKENGALMIVLWNALVLHANWDRMVGKRGLAILAVIGNVVTSWSWFGTNQLGIGLHSYGFTSAMLVTLCVVFVGHMLFVMGMLLFTRSDRQPAT